MMSQETGTGMVPAPPELVELSLMERFHWTPDQIDNLDVGRMQRLFFVMEQKANAEQSVQQVRSQRAAAKAGQKGKKR